MDENKMAEAWAAFDKAVRMGEKAAQAAKEGGKEGMVRIATKAVDKHLAEACVLEAEAVAR